MRIARAIALAVLVAALPASSVAAAADCSPCALVTAASGMPRACGGRLRAVAGRLLLRRPGVCRGLPAFR